jgi:hypothetical protein
MEYRIVVLPREGVYDGNKILEEIREGEGENGHVKLQFSLLCLMQALESKDVRLTVSIYPEIPKFEPPVTPKDTTQPRYLASFHLSVLSLCPAFRPLSLITLSHVAPRHSTKYPAYHLILSVSFPMI